MKLALVIASLGNGGAERVMSLLANAFAERGDAVTLITLDTMALDAYPLDPRIVRVALDLVRDSTGFAPAVKMNGRRLLALRRAIAQSGATTVLSFEDRTNVLAVIATLGLRVRCVVSERTDPTVHRVGAVWEALRRLTYPLAHAVVVQTARLLPWARRTTLGRDTARAIPNPLRTLAAEPRAGHARDNMVVALGRLSHEKGHDVLLRAFASVAQEFPAWRLTIVGEGSERPALASLAAELGIGERVTLPGWMDVPEAVLARSAIFVMASRYEGFPNALLEAMGAGLPIVSTACRGSEELVDPGTTGYVVPVEDVAALAGAMRQLMADPGLRARLGANALVASERYTGRSVIPMWDAVLAGRSASAKSCSSTAR